MKTRAIGVLETRSIIKGIEASDAMLKAASVFLVFSGAVCPGKYLIIIGGEVGAIENSLLAGKKVVEEYFVDDLIIPNVSDDVFPAIGAVSKVDKLKSIAMVETFTLPGAILAADTMVKSASVSLIEIRLAKGLGGKAFVIATGEVGACEAAVDAVKNRLKGESLLIECVVIPRPHEGIKQVIF